MSDTISAGNIHDSIAAVIARIINSIAREWGLIMDEMEMGMAVPSPIP